MKLILATLGSVPCLTMKAAVYKIWFLLLALYVISAPFEGYIVVPGTGGHSIVSLLQRLIVLPLPLYVLYQTLRQEPHTPWWYLVLLTAWLLWVGLTFAIFSPHTYYYVYYTWEQIAGYLLVLSLWTLSRHRTWAKATVLFTLFLYYGATLMVSFWEIRTAHHLGHSSEGGAHPKPIPTAFFYGPNHLGAALALILPFIAFAASLVRTRWAYIISSLFTLAGLYVLYKTGSRGGELAIIIEFAALPFVLPRPYKRLALVALAAVLVVFTSLMLYMQALPQTAHLPFALTKVRHIADLFAYHPHRVTAHQGPGSLAIRLALLHSGLQALSHHPWGLGPRGAERYYLYYVHHKSPYNTYGVIDAHNMWLEIAIDFGWLGLSLYVVFYAALLQGLYRLRHASDAFQRYVAWSGFIALTGFIIGSVSPSSVMIGFNIMWIVYGTALIAIRQGTEDGAINKKRHRQDTAPF
ncbi:polymerase [Sulfobacillus sp. hq2]|nr:polymerase [Sulfobacillus sp. hq2]